MHTRARARAHCAHCTHALRPFYSAHGVYPTGALDHSFFEELEDLKYALQQSNKLNGALDNALRAAAVNAGVPYTSLLPDLGAVLGASFRKSRGIASNMNSSIASGGGGDGGGGRGVDRAW